MYPILSGTSGVERWLEVVTNNLANVNTAGFKRDFPLFSGEEAQGGLEGEGMTASLEPSSVFSTLSHVLTDFSAGVIRKTGRPLDVAVEGEGFFAVQTPEGTRYTRGGGFTLDAEGQLVTPSGFAVLGEGGPIALPPGEVIQIDPDGRVSVDGIDVDRLLVMEIGDLGLAVKQGENLIDAGDAAVFPLQGGRVRQGALEGSNVDPVGEMAAMIRVLRLYEAAQKAVQTLDQMEQQAATEVGKVG